MQDSRTSFDVSGIAMATRSFYGYDAGALIYDADTNSYQLDPAYDTDVNRVRFFIDDDDDSLDGDEHNAEVGEDANQLGTVTRPDGSTIASGRIYGEETLFLEAPDGSTIAVDSFEIAGVLVGYIPTEPLQKGVSYDFVGSQEIDNILMSQGGADTRQTYEQYQQRSVPCFGPGTMITTQNGDIPVEWLETGDRVLTRDNGYQPIVWIGRTKLQPGYFAEQPEARPVCLPAGALGPGMPTHDLQVTGDHRVLINSAQAELLFCANEVLAPAKAWIDRGVARSVIPMVPYTLTGIACAQHQIILAEGAWVETMFAGAEVFRRLSQQDANSLRSAVDAVAENQVTARPCLSRTEARLLIEAGTAMLEDIALSA
ncbi:Hint domain-containing protein [uncultured Roseobacter sp.]|uniref:Hint domain-containing protein n=1 Tax=uncultured Roseobacter sp. TaxID=114847 RepID=UPI00263244DC|nr:Hint domain-containing protein [uncultured Roseobacter sp.]